MSSHNSWSCLTLISISICHLQNFKLILIWTTLLNRLILISYVLLKFNGVLFFFSYLILIDSNFGGVQKDVLQKQNHFELLKLILILLNEFVIPSKINLFIVSKLKEFCPRIFCLSKDVRVLTLYYIYLQGWQLLI